MYRTIAVPLDGSKVSELALPYAVALAKRSGGHVHLLHVLPDGATAWIPSRDESDAAARQQMKAYLDGLARRIREEAGVAATGALLAGATAESLRRHADAVDAELVVMTTHGRGGLERAWLGSVADRFVRTAERPVLLVPAKGEWQGDLATLPAVEKVLVTLDGSPTAEEILDPAVSLADGDPVTFVLVRVASVPALSGVYGSTGYAFHLLDDERQLRREKQREAQEYLESVRGRLESASRLMEPAVLLSNEPATAILEHARERGADVIAIATRGRGGVARMVFGSVADKVIRAESPPVLVYRPRAPAAIEESEPAAAAG